MQRACTYQPIFTNTHRRSSSCLSVVVLLCRISYNWLFNTTGGPEYCDDGGWCKNVPAHPHKYNLTTTSHTCGTSGNWVLSRHMVASVSLGISSSSAKGAATVMVLSSLSTCNPNVALQWLCNVVNTTPTPHLPYHGKGVGFMAFGGRLLQGH